MQKEKLIMTERERKIVLKLLTAWFEDYENHEERNRKDEYHSIIYSHEKIDEVLNDLFNRDETWWNCLSHEAKYRAIAPDLFKNGQTWDEILPGVWC